MRKTVKTRCQYCNLEFNILPSVLARKLRSGGANYCSIYCKDKALKQSVFFRCENCDVEFGKQKSKVSPHNFCSKSCAATYNNTHKSKGTRRSKLEIYIEKRLLQDFPNLEILFNDKVTIGSELDIYFPQLRLAFELNGILHYEPIYGSDKLEQIRNNDLQKVSVCRDNGIELVTLDVSSLSYLKPDRAEKYYLLIKNLVVQLLGRAG